MEKINGEYNRVYHWSKCKDLIEASNLTPINHENAIVLIRLLEDEIDKNSGFNRIGRCKVNFTRKYGCAKLRTWELCLPKDILPESTYTPIGYLRVGLVIHEFAHLVAYKMFKTYKHDRNFVIVLDSLLKYWSDNIRVNTIDKTISGCKILR